MIAAITHRRNGREFDRGRNKSPSERAAQQGEGETMVTTLHERRWIKRRTATGKTLLKPRHQCLNGRGRRVMLTDFNFVKFKLTTHNIYKL